MKALFVTFICLFSSSLVASEIQKRQLRTGYYNQMFGHIHQTPSRYSTSLTNIACGHPLRIMSITQAGQTLTLFNDRWKFISAGPYEGYLPEKFISTERPECFQDKYARFYEAFDLSITEMHFWGRLYDHFLIEKTELQ